MIKSTKEHALEIIEKHNGGISVNNLERELNAIGALGFGVEVGHILEEMEDEVYISNNFVSKKAKEILEDKLFVIMFDGDEYEPPAVYVCCRGEYVFNEKFPRSIQPLKQLVLFTADIKRKKLIEDMVEAYNNRNKK